MDGTSPQVTDSSAPRLWEGVPAISDEELGSLPSALNGYFVYVNLKELARKILNPPEVLDEDVAQPSAASSAASANDVNDDEVGDDETESPSIDIDISKLEKDANAVAAATRIQSNFRG